MKRRHDTLTGYDFAVDPPLQRAEAIYKKYLECQGNNRFEVRDCEISDCTLWPWRNRECALKAQEAIIIDPQVNNNS